MIPTACLLRSAPRATRRAESMPTIGVPDGHPVAAKGGAFIILAWPVWAIGITHFACCAAHSGPIFHMVSHAIDKGVASMPAAALLGMSGLSSILGRVGAGVVADRYGAKQTLVAMLMFQAAMVALYLVAHDLATLTVLGLVFGVAYGGAMPLYAVLTREYFGEKILGTAYGIVFFISCIGMGLGSWTGGVIHDALGTYQWLFIASSAIGIMAVIMGITLRPPIHLVPRATVDRLALERR